MGNTSGREKSEILRHDRLIVANELRFALSSWGDRLFALAILVVALAAVRSALSHRPIIFAATAVGGVGTAIGATAARLIARRLDFHSDDGLLAADALDEDSRRQYAVSIHVLACVIISACAVIARPTAAVLAPIGYVIGASVTHIARRLMFRDTSPRRSSARRSIRHVLQRPIAGAVTAVPAILLVLLLKSAEVSTLAAVLGLISAVTALVLTSLDYQIVRFLTESGYTAGRIISMHARSVLIFLLLAVIASLVLSDTLVAIVIFSVVLATLVFMTTRILAYRIFPKRAADTIVSICGIACFTAIAMPMLLPVIIIAILWQLHRRAAPATWMLT